jgi:transcriptional regulator with XRE-family HTH domain
MPETYSVLESGMSRPRPSSDVRVPYLRSVREMRALSQEDLAKLAGVSRATIIELERAEGGRNAWPKTITKLAKALHVRPDQLTGRKLSS